MIRVLDNDTFFPLLVTAHPMRIDVKDEKRATKFPVETGALRSDHVIDELTEISVEFLMIGMLGRLHFEELRMFYESKRLVTVVCDMGVYPDMLIEAMPHTESPSMLSTGAAQLRFVEWREVAPEYGELQQEDVAAPQHASTQQRGRQSGMEPIEVESQRGGSIMSRWFS